MPVGIIGAMDEEIEQYLNGMEIDDQINIAGVDYHRGKLAQKDVVVCKSGVGKVNAAITCQIMIDHFKPNYIVFTGVAGAVDPELDIGDIVVSSEAQYHDMDASALGFKRGEIPFADVSVFKADAYLVNLAYQASLENTEGKSVTGKILSGDQFIADRDRVHELYTFFKGSCTEMEGAAVAHVCYKHRVPFVIVRSMSDRADGKAHVNFAEFTKMAAERSYQIVQRMMQRITE